MRTSFVRSALVVCAVLCASPALAWGTAAHRTIMERAIELLPPELKPFFVHFKAELVIRVVDPDVWRSAGWEEDQNHFLDFGVPEFGAYPFTALPRELDAAIEKFGLATLKKDGLLPWREAEEFGNLRRAFEGFARGASFAPGDTVLFAAVASHYIQDAHQPLHASNNYDGQLTGQNGLHSRFESVLFERFRARLTLTPPPPKPITHPRDAAFDVLLESSRLVGQLLQADRDAVAGKTIYDDDYFEKLFGSVGPMLERRISESISATAAVIVGAWEAAGRPAVLTEMPRQELKVRTPK